MLTFEEIKELVELVAKNRLSGIEVEEADFRLKVDGEAKAVAAPVVAPVAAAAVAPAPAAVAPVAAPVAAAPAPAPAAEAEAAEDAPAIPEDAHILRSPMVGTYYQAPSPESPAFVKVGDSVQKGSTLCIVEAMKLMNEIESEVDGEIIHIYGQNGQPVEYNEPLFAIRTH